MKQPKIILIVLVIIALSILVVFLYTRPKNDTNLKQQKTTEQKIEQVMWIDKDDLFLEFWKVFKKAVLNKDLSTLETMIHFPFRDGYGEIYRPNFLLTSKNMDEFKDKFDLLFNECVVKAIKGNEYRGYDESKYHVGDGEYEDIIGETDFLLVASCSDNEVINEGRDLIFRKIGKKYYLRGIQYYP